MTVIASLTSPAADAFARPGAAGRTFGQYHAGSNRGFGLCPVREGLVQRRNPIPVRKHYGEADRDPQSKRPAPEVFTNGFEGIPGLPAPPAGDIPDSNTVPFTQKRPEP